jgi:hypothetical protein
MRLMRRRFRLVLALVVWLPMLVVLSTRDGAGIASASQELPGTPAPPDVVAEIQQTVDAAVSRFEAMDTARVLTHVSDQYRTGTLTKAGVAEQLRAVFALHDQIRTRVRIDDVRMVGELAWVYSSGTVTGRLRYLGSLVPVASWERELEVARRENGRWRLYGYQQ